MATVHQVGVAAERDVHTVSVGRLAISGGITAAALFVLCWLGTFIPFSSPTHAYISLFTRADISSRLALVEGTCWSLLFGIVVGAVFGLIYNATRSFSSK